MRYVQSLQFPSINNFATFGNLDTLAKFNNLEEETNCFSSQSSQSFYNSYIFDNAPRSQKISKYFGISKT